MLHCKNFAFDVTPAKFITKIITERKVVNANRIINFRIKSLMKSKWNDRDANKYH